MTTTKIKKQIDQLPISAKAKRLFWQFRNSPSLQAGQKEVLDYILARPPLAKILAVTSLAKIDALANKNENQWRKIISAEMKFLLEAEDKAKLAGLKMSGINNLK